MFLLILGLFKGFWGFSEALRCHAPGEKATDQRKILDLGSQNSVLQQGLCWKGTGPGVLTLLGRAWRRGEPTALRCCLCVLRSGLAISMLSI